ncbi:hypothetical protein [Streptomyces sp. NPDC017964]|uniref:hypothetical protein n=1 Tax=Streptomyces sp. NPDC017964 TaxID=3365022 RepID=UPI00379013AA
MVVKLGRTVPVEGGAQVRIPMWILDSGLLPGAVVLYARMTAMVDRDSTFSEPLTRLAKTAQVSVRTVQKQLAALRDAGALTIHYQNDSTGNRLPNLYVLNVAPPAPDGGGGA